MSVNVYNSYIQLPYTMYRPWLVGPRRVVLGSSASESTPDERQRGVAIKMDLSLTLYGRVQLKGYYLFYGGAVNNITNESELLPRSAFGQVTPTRRVRLTDYSLQKWDDQTEAFFEEWNMPERRETLVLHHRNAPCAISHLEFMFIFRAHRPQEEGWFLSPLSTMRVMQPAGDHCN